MLNVVDIILLALAVYFFLLGFIRGFLHSIFGPLALIIGSWFAYLYYLGTHQVFFAMCLGLILPIIISLILRFVIGGFIKSLNPEGLPGLASRLSGGFITLVWGWIFVIFTVVLIDIFPAVSNQLNTVQQSIHQSTLAAITVLPFRNIIIPPANDKNKKPVDIRELTQDPRIAQLMNDPEIQQAAQKHDITSMLKNPKVMKLAQEMMSDPELMKKMMSALKQMQEQLKK